MGRIAGIDYGRARIGIAVSDPMGMLASPKRIIQAGKTPEASAALVAKELEEVEHFVVGLPLHMSGDEGIMSKEVRAFAKTLEDLSGKGVTLWDERLSSQQVQRTLKESFMNRKKRAQHVDTMSAALILQSYLDTKLY